MRTARTPSFWDGTRQFRNLMTKKCLLFIFWIGLQPSFGGAAETGSPIDASLAALQGGGETTSTNKVEKLQAGDHLNVKIYPEDEYIKGGDMVVSNEGDITLALIGKIKVNGLKPSEAEREIVKLLAQDYLVNPVVVIEVTRNIAKEARASVSILGQVQKPGTYQLPQEGEKKLTLLQLISMAGGFTDVANVKKIKIIRKAGGKAEVIRANAEAIISGAQADIELKEQDVVHVGESLF